MLQIKGRDLVGLSEVASSLGEIEGVARDSKGRIYVSSDNEENGEVRAIDEKGQALRVVAPAGDRKEIAGDQGGGKDEEKFEPAAGGTVNAPKQLADDRLDRLIVADAGNDRVQVFAGYDQGNALLASLRRERRGRRPAPEPERRGHRPGRAALRRGRREPAHRPPSHGRRERRRDLRCLSGRRERRPARPAAPGRAGVSATPTATAAPIP
ncbi:MAG: hypothetical protein WKF31_12155 [Thermoleophilaceae bacterium]